MEDVLEQDRAVADLLGFTPPRARRRLREASDATAELERQVALRRQEVADTGSAPPPNLQNLNVADVMHGVTVGWLATAFSMDPTTVKKKLRDCPPIFRRKAGFVYDLKQAAPYLVPPVFDVGQYLKTMKASDLPTHLQEAYWSAMRKRQQWEADAAHLWRTEQVMEVLGEVFKHIKFAIQLWPDQVERAIGLSAEQRVTLTKMGDTLQNEIHKRLIKMPEQQHTPSSLSEAPTEPLLPVVAPDDEDEDDDGSSLI